MAGTLPEHASCKNHERYWLTCEQYEGLIAACGNRCQTCSEPAASCRPHNKLLIDHDQRYGIWAVRGLLCSRCNGTLRWDRPTPDWATDYVQHPWFKQAFAEMGISIEPGPEPPVGSIFYSPRGTSWVRKKEWWQNRSFARSRRDWRGMCRDFSPVHLQNIHVAKKYPRSIKVSIRPDNPVATAEVLREHMSAERRSELAFLLLGP